MRISLRELEKLSKDAFLFSMGTWGEWEVKVAGQGFLLILVKLKGGGLRCWIRRKVGEGFATRHGKPGAAKEEFATSTVWSLTHLFCLFFKMTFWTKLFSQYASWSVEKGKEVRGESWLLVGWGVSRRGDWRARQDWPIAASSDVTGPRSIGRRPRLSAAHLLPSELRASSLPQLCPARSSYRPTPLSTTPLSWRRGLLD